MENKIIPENDDVVLQVKDDPLHVAFSAHQLLFEVVFDYQPRHRGDFRKLRVLLSVAVIIPCASVNAEMEAETA